MKASHTLTTVCLTLACAPRTLDNPMTVPDAGVMACSNSNRWTLKTGSDDQAASVDISHAVDATIEQLQLLTAPESLPERHRQPPTETGYFALHDVTMTRFKIDDDFAIHFVVVDAVNNSMILDIPDPRCVPEGSPWKARIVETYEQFRARFHPNMDKTNVQEIISVEGVALFDHIHGQHGISANGLGLAPILRFCTLPHCALH